jgi:hypothetical protein
MKTVHGTLVGQSREDTRGRTAFLNPWRGLCGLPADVGIVFATTLEAGERGCGHHVSLP